MHDLAIEVCAIGKVYEIYPRAQDRLKQLVLGRWRTYHHNFQALSAVSFEVERGRCVGIIGRNGAGKSTLLQILTGTMLPSQGELRVRGRVAAVLELGSGFNPEFSGRQNAEMYGSLFGLSNQEVRSRMGDIERFAGIGEFMDRPVKTYSSGMQARLAFAVIAHVDADVLIIDEALSVGDAAFTQKCLRFLRDFKTRGSILFVSHDMGAITAFCDQAIWLEAGQVRFQGSAKEACERYYAFMQTGEDEGPPRAPEDALSPLSPSQPLPVAQPALRPAPSPISAAADGVAPATPAIPHSARITPLRLIVESSHQATPEPGLQRIECFGFNQDSKRHGNGHARIREVEFVDAKGRVLDISKGGDEVCIRMTILALCDVDMPIVGFIIKDRHGQPLMGGNTYHTYRDRPMRARQGHCWEVVFGFKLPILAVGDYSVTAAIGEGTLAEHVHMDWMHDAVLFKVIETSIEGVIVGVPLEHIHMTTYSPQTP